MDLKEMNLEDAVVEVIEAAMCVVATSKGTSYGLSEVDQLRANRLAATELHKTLLNVVNVPVRCEDCFLKGGCDFYDMFLPIDCPRFKGDV